MNRQVEDATLTSDIVWAAAKRIGKASNADDINRICEYLISKHWFQNAGDLRAARQNAQEWQALEVPSRLKIAIQDVLDTPADVSSYSPDKHHAHVDVATVYKESNADLEPASCIDRQTTGEQAALSADLYGAANASSAAYPQPYTQNAITSSAGEYYSDTYSQAYQGGYSEDYTQGGVTGVQPLSEEDEAAAAAAHAAAWAAYYATNGYYQYYDESGNPVATWDYNTQEAPVDEVAGEAVVEAAEVVVEEAVAVEEVGEAVNKYEWHSALESVPVQSDTTWQCGQCTYANSFGVAFCEVCCGHISLSPDAPAETQPPPPPTSIEPVNAVAPATYESSSHNLSLDIPQPPAIYEYATDPTPDLPPPPSPVVPTSRPALPLEPPLYVAIPCPAEPTSPLYSPSAPDFECITLEDEPSALRTATAQIEAETVKQLPVFTQFPGTSEKDAEVSPPIPTTQPSPSPPKIDYRALAFKRANSMSSIGVSTGLSPPKSPVRTATEFSF